jgi:hypothetical protein
MSKTHSTRNLTNRPGPAPGPTLFDGYEVRFGLTAEDKESNAMRLAVVILLGTSLVGLPTWWTALGGKSSLCACRHVEPEAAIDLHMIDALRDRALQNELDLSDEQRVEVAGRLALILDSDQRDLLQMILGQYHADGNRLRELEDPSFEDDEEGASYELHRLRAMAEGFRSRAAAMVDHVLTAEQQTALGPRPDAPDPDAMFKGLSALERESVRAIAAALTPHQRERIKELTLEAEGPLAAVRPVVAVRLKISCEQQTRVRAIWDVAQAGLNRLRDPSPVSPAYREGDDLDVWMRPRLPTIRRESARILATAAERINEVLQESQVHAGPPCPSHR